MAELKENRIWIDGCFDFFHHGHANAILQAKQFGDELYIGLHTDEDIFTNKGPTVMNFKERSETILGNKWITELVPNAPYVTDPDWMNEHGCKYVVHGDDISTDANGNDCYGIVRDKGRLILVKRTGGVSTTDLINILLNRSNDHYLTINDDFITKYKDILKKFGTGEDGKTAYNGIYLIKNKTALETLQVPQFQEDQKYIYVKGSYDLFHPFHIKSLSQLKSKGFKIIIGVYEDAHEFTIMNVIQRSLSALQCKHVDSIIIGVTDDDSVITKKFQIEEIISIDDLTNEFAYLKDNGIQKRIQDNINLYKERQLKKLGKAEYEKILESQKAQS
ncbi:hypothetical protein WICPIJ_005886 [Wickerhamomyces pijperi]|uniref:ethanolamine-phosphate cytidylyltransferase n=1 Tax=Wickerhamomyces pijperi TaxID=599730 RepID=A0A9P8Q2P4_WICPI|nr:hypothetical protein WICPIJ_005886 [Wickerhamomyces pijperi]